MHSDLSWLCGGDFNEVVDNIEYFRAHDRVEWQMAGFREVIDDCEFQGLGFNGIPFTWDNKQEDVGNVKVRLDRFLANPMGLRHIPSPRLDHRLVTTRIKKLRAAEG